MPGASTVTSGGEVYRRHIVMWRALPGDQLRPFASFDSLKEAVRQADVMLDRWEQAQRPVVKLTSQAPAAVIDVENFEMGDMLVNEDAAELVAVLRAQIRREERAS